jgi:hypothetical protein
MVAAMTDRIALGLAIVLAAAAAADLGLNGGAALFFLFGRLTDLVAYLAFWR